MDLRFSSRDEYEKAIREAISRMKSISGSIEVDRDTEYDQLVDEYLVFCSREKDVG